MAKFLLNNIGGRDHKTIYKNIANNAVFDCGDTQIGWKCYAQIHIGDEVFLIDSNRQISTAYRITMIADEVSLSGANYDVFESLSGGDIRVLFGQEIEWSNPEQDYGEFVINNNVTFGKMFNPITGKLKAPGFNCCEI